MNNIKKIIIFTVLSSMSLAFAAPKSPILSTKENSELSYAIGFEMGQAFNDNNIQIDSAYFTRGVKEGLSGEENPFLSKEKIAKVLKYFRNKTITEKQKALKIQAKKNLAGGKTFLEQNAKKSGIITLSNGLQYKILESGTSNEKPTINNTVAVSYIGEHLDGKSFDQSKRSTFKVSNVIAGWQQILPMMKVGDRWKVYIPSHLAYGPGGAPDIIGPNETIVYEIYLTKVINT